jgi:hypothetical protein
MSTEKQNKQLVARFVEHQEFFSSLSNDDAQWAIQNPQSAVELFVGAIKNRPVPKASILELIGTTVIPATDKKLVAKDFFTEKKFYLGDNFKDWFLKKIEDPIGEVNVRYQKLTKSSVDGPIIAELGGEEKVETTLATIADLIGRQAKGENGILLTNGYANIFYVRDATELLRAVSVYWCGDRWNVDADSVELPSDWNDDRQVFSR